MFLSGNNPHLIARQLALLELKLPVNAPKSSAPGLTFGVKLRTNDPLPV